MKDDSKRWVGMGGQKRRDIIRSCLVERHNKQPKRKGEDISEIVVKEEVKSKVDKTKVAVANTSEKVDERKIEQVFHELPRLPLAPSVQHKGPGVIFVFEKASLVPAYVGKTYQILNPEDHANFLRRKKMDPYSYRPDIIFEALLEVTDSNLYKSGQVQAIYVKTDQGVLIKIEPNTRLPKTFESFCSLMYLLQKFSNKAKGKGGKKLLRLVKNPVTQHLPVNSLKIGLSFSSQKLVPLKEYVGAINNDVNLVFVVGAMAHGKVDFDYVDEIISVSRYPLSAVCCLRWICCALEKKRKIL